MFDAMTTILCLISQYYWTIQCFRAIVIVLYAWVILCLSMDNPLHSYSRILLGNILNVIYE